MIKNAATVILFGLFSVHFSACVATRSSVDIHELAEEAFVPPAELKTADPLPPDTQQVAYRIDRPSEDDTVTVSESLLDHAEPSREIQLLAGDTRLGAEPETPAGPFEGIFLSVEVSWSRDIVSTPHRPVEIAAFEVHSMGQTVDWGISSRSYYWDWTRMNAEAQTRTVISDPVVYYASFGQYKRHGSLIYGLTAGVTYVRAITREDVYTDFGSGFSAWVSGESQNSWTAGVGVDGFVGLMDGAEYALGIEMSYMHSKFGTFISTGAKFMVLLY